MRDSKALITLCVSRVASRRPLSPAHCPNKKRTVDRRMCISQTGSGSQNHLIGHLFGISRRMLCIVKACIGVCSLGYSNQLLRSAVRRVGDIPLILGVFPDLEGTSFPRPRKVLPKSKNSCDGSLSPISEFVTYMP